MSSAEVITPVNLAPLRRHLYAIQGLISARQSQSRLKSRKEAEQGLPMIWRPIAQLATSRRRSAAPPSQVEGGWMPAIGRGLQSRPKLGAGQSERGG